MVGSSELLRSSKLFIAPIKETKMDRDFMADIGIVATILSMFFIVTIFIC